MATRDKRFGFTKARLGAVEPTGGSSRDVYYDAKQPGLCLFVGPTGSKAFYLYKWASGRPVQLKLGDFPAMAVERARALARSMLADFDKGIDVAARRRQVRQEETFGGLFSYWIENHAKQHKRTWKEDQRQYDRMLKPSWSNRKMSAITRADVQALHVRIGREHGRYAANRLLALVRAVFNKAADVGFRGENPARGVRKYREEKRDRFLSGDELARFLSALQAEGEDFRDFFTLCLLTGARRSNLQAMRWQDLNLESALWRIPPEAAKAGEVIVVPLVPQAVEILQRRRNGSPWVFPSRFAARSKEGHLTSPKSAWERIVKRAGLSDVRLHDLRRTLGSWMAAQNVSLTIIGKVLGHTQPSTTAVYARLQVDPARAAIEQATDAMFATDRKLLGE